MMPAMALDAEALGMTPGKLGDDWFMRVRERLTSRHAASRGARADRVRGL